MRGGPRGQVLFTKKKNLLQTKPLQYGLRTEEDVSAGRDLPTEKSYVDGTRQHRFKLKRRWIRLGKYEKNQPTPNQEQTRRTKAVGRGSGLPRKLGLLLGTGEDDSCSFLSIEKNNVTQWEAGVLLLFFDLPLPLPFTRATKVPA